MSSEKSEDIIFAFCSIFDIIIIMPFGKYYIK